MAKTPHGSMGRHSRMGGGEDDDPSNTPVRHHRMRKVLIGIAILIVLVIVIVAVMYYLAIRAAVDDTTKAFTSLGAAIAASPGAQHSSNAAPAGGSQNQVSGQPQ